jgi:hypothetical protein
MTFQPNSTFGFVLRVLGVGVFLIALTLIVSVLVAGMFA